MTYTLSRYNGIEEINENSLTLFNRLTGKRMKINHAVQEFLFDVFPKCTEEDLNTYLKNDQFKQIFSTLVQQGFIVEKDKNEIDLYRFHNSIEQPKHTFFNCPPYTKDKNADFTLIGFPYFYGSSTASNVNEAPDILRKFSSKASYELNPTTHKPTGIWSNTTGQHLLKDKTLADLGNLKFYPGEAEQHLKERLSHALRPVFATNTCPISIGGDHTISHFILDNLSQECAIVHFDAHPDANVQSSAFGLNHANVFTAISKMAHVKHIYTFGIRNFGRFESTEKQTLYTMNDTQLDIFKMELTEKLEKNIPIYISIDADVLNPQEFPAVNYPEPFGLTLHSLIEMVSFLGENYSVCGMDFVEFVPSKDTNNICALTSVELLLQLMNKINR